MAGTRTIPLTRGGVATVDEDDYERLIAFGSWHLSDTGYAVKKTRREGKSVTYRMHRVINNTPYRLETDHINGDRLDNRKTNLRTVSQAMNTWNKTKDPRHWVHEGLPRGVTFDYGRNKYYASRVQRRRFDNLEDAIKFTKGEN